MKKVSSIKESIIKSYISKSLISKRQFPSNNIVCDILNRDFVGADTFTSLVSNSDKINRFENISRDKYQNTLDMSYIDISTMYKANDIYYDNISNISTLLLNKYTMLKRSLKDIYNDAQSILVSSMIKNQNTTSNIYDSFINSNNIDTNNTNANIDYDNGYVFSAYSNNSTMKYVDVDNIFSTIINTGYLYYGNIDGYNIENVSNNEQPWIQEIHMPHNNTDEITVSVKIKLNNINDINRILININDSIRYKISLYAKVNGIFKQISDYSYYTNVADIEFDSIKTDNIVLYFKISEHFYSNDKIKKYRININNILYGNPEYSSSSVFMSKLYNVDRFSSIMLYTEDYSDEDTSIIYDVYFNNKWHNILPFNNDIIDFNNRLYVIDSYSLTKNEYYIDLSINNQYITYNNISTNILYPNIDNIQIKDPTILRNINGYTNIDNMINIYMYSNSDIQVDFSKYPGYLDDRKISSILTLKQGIYKFTFRSEYSNKYIPYFKSLSPNIIFGSHISKYINIDKFNTYKDNKNIFSIINHNGNNIVIVKKMDDLSIPDTKHFYDEKLLLIEKDIDQTTIDSLPNSIKLRATLKSNNKKSPKIFNYTLKLI